jgi:fumarylacetoacetate (FAA) hydrolase family protein
MTAIMKLPTDGTFLGRARAPGTPHPLVVTVRDGDVVDITSGDAPTVRDVCELVDPVAYVSSAKGRAIAALEDVEVNSLDAGRDKSKPYLLSPVDLQAVKASGVTFVVSLLERVIEEQARGSAEKADAIRADIASLIGHDLSKLKPGSEEALAIKAKLIARGAWSQYLEVGIGPDAEVFTKAQPMSAVGQARKSACIRSRSGAIPSRKSCSPSAAEDRRSAPRWATT